MASTRKRLEALTAGLVLPSDPEPIPPVDVAGSMALPSASPVETKFPPAVGGSSAPRTGPGQMMAFRGQIQAVEGEVVALRERLRQYDGALPTRKIDPVRVRPSRWANRHESSFLTSAFAGLKADIEHAGGNVQPILVRPVRDEDGIYELVFGHRRHRACLELGIPVLASIWLDDLGDAALFAAMDRENRERADLSAYEQGVMYQRALDEHLFPTQRQLAEGVGVSHTWVRKALAVAQLPTTIVECFRTPLEITFRHAEQINAELDRDRRQLLKRAEKLRGLGIGPAHVVARLLDVQPAYERAAKVDVKIGDASVGTLVRSKTGEVVITLRAGCMVRETRAIEVAVGDAIRSALTID